jgi:hypothetical protein
MSPSQGLMAVIGYWGLGAGKANHNQLPTTSNKPPATNSN